MSAYVRSLDDLAGAVAHNVLDPTQGYDALQSLVSAHQQAKQDQRAAQQDALSSLAQMAYESSMGGGNVQQLGANPAFASGVSSLRPRMQGQLQDSLAGLFTSQGTSALKPTLPSDYAATLGDVVIQKAAAGIPLVTVKQLVHDAVKTDYPAEYAAYFPMVEDLIDSVYSGSSAGTMVRAPGPSGG